MPKLPNAERAFVDIAKLRDYSLNSEHEKGKHKARVLRSALGFTTDDAERLRGIILDAAHTNEARQVPPNAYGERFIVEFQMLGQRGQVTVRTSWIVLDGEDFPRLTSCDVL